MSLIICAVLAIIVIGVICTVIAIIVGVSWQSKNTNNNKQFCDKCGAPLTGSTNYCSKCGNKI